MDSRPGMQGAYWMCRLFVAAQIAFCFLIGIGPFGRAIAGLVVLLSVFLSAGFRLSKFLHTFLLVFGGLYFASLAISRVFGETRAGLLELFELLAEYLMIVQALELLRKRSPNLSTYRETNYLPGLGTMVVIMLIVSRDVRLSVPNLTLLLTCIPVLLALVMRPDFLGLLMGTRIQRRKAATLVCIIAISLAAGSLFRGEVARQLPILQSALRKIQPEMDESQQIVIRSRAQFVQRVDLSSVSLAQRTNPDELVFKAESASSPGYMRTLSFEQFDGFGWKNSWSNDRRSPTNKATRVAPLDVVPNGLSLERIPRETFLYPLPNCNDTGVTEVFVTIPANIGRLVPLPLSTAYILATPRERSRQLTLDLHGNVWPNSIENSGYRAFAGSKLSWPVDESYFNRLQQLPDSDADFLKQLAAKICDAAVDAQGKSKAVEKFFVDNFEYSFEPNTIGELKGRSPLRAFLENREAGHCEFFATATAMLLRAQGVPTRLSTGYLVYEMDEDRNFYYARNRDAHAWVEAYDQESTEWILVESTPGIRAYISRFEQSQPEQAAVTNGTAIEGNQFGIDLTQLIDFVQLKWTQLLSLRFSWLIPVVLGGLLLGWRILRRQNASNVEVKRISPEVRRADRRAARMGFKREANETCLQFASRLFNSGIPKVAAMGDWYIAHGQNRYAIRDTAKAKKPEELEESLS